MSCTLCKRRASSKPDTFTVRASRLGGGNWARSGRMYRGYLCLRCIHQMIESNRPARHNSFNPTGRVHGYELKWILREVQRLRNTDMPDDIKTELDKLLAAASAPTAPVTTPTAQPAPPIADPVRRVTSKAEFDDALAKAPGPVAVLFTQTGCGYCEDDKKSLAELAAKCGTAGVTALEVEANPDDGELDKLATSFKVEGTPTILFAETAAKMTPRSAREVEVEQLKRKLKCARK